MYAIECKDLTKKYEDVTAVDHLNLTLEKNKIYGLLGPNGAGKTTLLKLIANQILPTCGKIFLDQKDIAIHPMDELVFYVREFSEYYKDLKPKDLFSLSKIIKPTWDEENKNRLLKIFQVPLKKPLKNLSKGQQSMVNIILGLCAMTPIIIFDESYLGLDALHRHQFFKELRNHYIQHGTTFILSTHYIDEAANLFEEVLLIDQGKILCREAKDAIEEKAFEILLPQEQVSHYFSKSEILAQEAFGARTKCAVYTNLSKEKKEALISLGAQIEKMSLEKWFVHTMQKGEQ